MDWFEQYGNNFHHIALTSVPRKFSYLSAYWIAKYFGNWIRSINFVYSKRGDDNNFQYFKNRGEFLQWFGYVDIYIDDNEKNLEESKELNPELICLCLKQSWNNGMKIDEILKKLNKEICVRASQEFDYSEVFPMY